MKFIIRNLGWVLLIIFFLFMLYLISSQNNKKDIISTGSWIILNNVDKWDINDITIDNLEIKKNDAKTITKIISSKSSLKNISDEIDIDSNTGDILNNIKDFFTINKTNNNLKIEEKNTKKNEIITINKDNNITWVVDEELIKKVDKIVWSNDKNTISNSINMDNNKENTKKIKTVGVKSIFLNNAYFTKRLYTAYRWDKLEQLTPINKYGCFKIKIISSKNKLNNWKIAWTCEYYMEWKTDTIKEFKNLSKKYYKNIKTKKITSVNKIKKVSVEWVFLNNAYFTKRLYTVYKWDKVEQLTNINKYGCFKIKVIYSKNPLNIWKIAWTCQKYLK